MNKTDILALPTQTAPLLVRAEDTGTYFLIAAGLSGAQATELPSAASVVAGFNAMTSGDLDVIRVLLDIPDPDAMAYIERVEDADGQPLESAVRSSINRLVLRAKSQGVWDPTAQFTLGCGARTMAGALVPLLGDPLTNVNFVEGDYDRVIGLTPSAGKYLQGVPGDTYGQDDFLAFSYARSAFDPLGAAVRFLGTAPDAGGVAISVASSDILQSRGKSNNQSTDTNAAGLEGFLGVSRNAPSEFRIYSSVIDYVSSFASNGNLADRIQYFAYQSIPTSGVPPMTSFFYGPYADGAVWRTILDLYHAELAAAMS